MEPCKAANVRRKTWVLSHYSRQGSKTQDTDVEGQPFPASTQEKESSPEEPDANKITSWLKECRTPHGASLDEQGNTPTRGVLKNGCSFEDDLSLGAEANHLQPNSIKAEPSCFEKRSQFQQRGMSITSSGSGRSNTTVSSVSELLDLYEEDPEETLYNLGFGTEEPDIAFKIPSRFFNASSSAKGIDIKVYLSAQLRRMELENPSSALTSRFRQIKVLTTVANAFSSLYSQVSGHPVQMIGESEPSEEPQPLKKNNSARNMAKILKKTLSKHNLQATGNGVETPNPAAVPSDAGIGSGSDLVVKGPGGNTQEHRSEHKQTKLLWKKESPCLATVTEEAHLSEHTGKGTPESKTDLVNGGLDYEEAGPSILPEGPSTLVEENLSGNECTADMVSNLDKDFLVQRPNPRIALLLTQTKDSFEMEEVQSVEGEAPLGIQRAGSEYLLRMASQHSDSSGFAEDTSVDSCAASLKVQESTESCDSGNTITSTACLNILDIEKLLGHKEDLITDVPSALDTVDSDMLNEDQIKPRSNMEVPSCVLHQMPNSGDGESAQTPVDHGPTSTSAPTFHPGPTPESVITTEVVSTSTAESSAELNCATDHSCGTNPPGGCCSSSKVRGAPLGAQQKAASLCKEQDAVMSAERSSGQQQLRLRRSSSLPTSLLSPCRVVSSVKIQIFPGAIKQFSPPTFIYSYTPEQEKEEKNVEAGSDMVDIEDQKRQEAGSTTPTMSHISQEPPLPHIPQQAEEQPSRVPPYPLYMPPHLSGSTCSLHSTMGDWPERPLGNRSQHWSTSSVPNLHHLGNPYGFHSAPCSMPNLDLLGSPHGLHNTPWSTHRHSPFNIPHSASCHNLHSAPCGLPCNCPHSAPCNNSPSSPYIASPNTLYNHLHSSACSPPFSDPHHLPYSAHPYPHPYSPLAAPLRPAHSPSSTEMQLRRVLHDIRSTVQNLTQCSSFSSDGFSSSVAFGQQGPVMPLYEELQDVRRSLNTFRTQMIDVELALVRQQSMVYHNLSDAERQEAQVLQQLRNAVRQELQELELQLEDRLLSLEEQLRTSHIASPYRHHMGLHRVRSSDSLSSASSLSAMEPVSEILKENLGHEYWSSTTYSPASGLSSRSVSPGRAARVRGTTRDRGSHTRAGYSSSRAGVYQASISLTPTPPPRPGMVPTSTSTQCSPPEKTDFGEQEARGSTVNPHLQQLIEQVKESIAEELRQEIINEILAAVAPSRSSM